MTLQIYSSTYTYSAPAYMKARSKKELRKQKRLTNDGSSQSSQPSLTFTSMSTINSPSLSGLSTPSDSDTDIEIQYSEKVDLAPVLNLFPSPPLGLHSNSNSSLPAIKLDSTASSSSIATVRQKNELRRPPSPLLHQQTPSERSSADSPVLSPHSSDTLPEDKGESLLDAWSHFIVDIQPPSRHRDHVTLPTTWIGLSSTFPGVDEYHAMARIPYCERKYTWSLPLNDEELVKRRRELLGEIPAGHPSPPKEMASGRPIGCQPLPDKSPEAENKEQKWLLEWFNHNTVASSTGGSQRTVYNLMEDSSETQDIPHPKRYSDVLSSRSRTRISDRKRQVAALKMLEVIEGRTSPEQKAQIATRNEADLACGTDFEHDKTPTKSVFRRKKLSWKRMPVDSLALTTKD
ncbi:hypothetical protein BT69DRAFT_1349069 [Atractiella rhizophila]|nr:hypothetical protein BT69DRAFT_1349069 [Atractiella rhizophila]